MAMIKKVIVTRSRTNFREQVVAKLLSLCIISFVIVNVNNTKTNSREKLEEFGKLHRNRKRKQHLHFFKDRQQSIKAVFVFR